MPPQRTHRLPLIASAGVDPRQVPPVRVDADLAAVPEALLTPQALARHFAAAGARPLPGSEICTETPDCPDEDAIPAAVLIPVIERMRPTVLLTQRATGLSSHSGQVAFPGGHIEARDGSARAAALRETQEEVGIAPEFVRVLGNLPEYVTGTGYRVTPVVALVRPGFRIQPDVREVADVFEVPLSFIMNPANHRHHELLIQGHMRRWLSMPYDDGGVERFIWGVSAAIIRRFYLDLAASAP